MTGHTWAVQYGDNKLMLFYDYYRAIVFAKAHPDARHWHKNSLGEWELIAWPGEISKTERRKQEEKMNRESLV